MSNIELLEANYCFIATVKIFHILPQINNIATCFLNINHTLKNGILNSIQ